MSFLQHLPSDEINAIHTAAINLGLSSSRTTLLGGLSPAFVATLPPGANPADQLLRDLQALNVIEALEDDSVPLIHWLTTARHLTSIRRESSVFKVALDKLAQKAAIKGVEAENAKVSGELRRDPKLTGAQQLESSSSEATDRKDAIMTTVSYLTPTTLGDGIDWDELKGPSLKKLHEAMLGAFPSRAALSSLLELGLGQSLDRVAGEGKLDHVMLELLTTARAQGWLFDLYEAAVAANPRNKKLLAFGKETPIRAVREEAGNVLETLTADKSALQKAVPGAPPPTDLETMLENLAEARGRVCRVEIGNRPVGTGFLVGPSAIMTNWHVVHDAYKQLVDGAEVKLRFDYRRARGRVVHEGTEFSLAEKDWLIDTLPPSALDGQAAPSAEPSLDELDYAVLRVDGEPGSSPVGGDRAALDAPKRGWVKIPPGSPALSLGSPIYIVQHPLGEPMSIAHSTQAVTFLAQNRTRVRYAVHTESGSSGSPCFSKDWSIVALHHSGQPAVNPRWNQGIPIDTIRDRLMLRGKWAAIEN